MHRGTVGVVHLTTAVFGNHGAAEDAVAGDGVESLYDDHVGATLGGDGNGDEGDDLVF